MSSHAIAIPAPFGPRQVREWFAKVGQFKESAILFAFSGGVDLEPGGAVLLRSASKARIEARAASDYLAQIEAVTDLRAARALANRAADELEAELGERVASSLRAARFSIEELAANVVQHSERPETGFGSACAYPASGRFQIAFADRGIGFRASLQKNSEFAGRVADDAAAIELALAKGVTRNGQGNLGIGLHFLTDLSDRLGGDLWIASGAAMLHRHGPRGARGNAIEAIAPWQGAWICLDTPAGP